MAHSSESEPRCRAGCRTPLIALSGTFRPCTLLWATTCLTEEGPRPRSATRPASRCVLLSPPDLFEYWLLRHRALGGQIWLRAHPRHELLGGGPRAASHLPGLSGFDFFGGLTRAPHCLGLTR